jgi:anti-anti-sigma factor
MTALAPLIQIEQPRPRSSVAVLLGEHDMSTCHEVREVLETLMQRNDVVVADLSQTQFIDSTIIAVLLEAEEAARGRDVKFRLQLGTTPAVEAAVQLSGILDVIACESTREAALGD